MQGLWLCLALFVALISANADIFMIKVEPRTEDCFYEDLKAGDKVTYEFHVVDGGLLDVEIRLFRQEHRYYTKLYFEGRDESIYSFVAENSGPYALCFNNEMSRWTVKTITFTVRVEKGELRKLPQVDLTPFETTIQRMEEDFEAIEKEQAYYRVREHTHRSVAETTNSRVYMWSLVESTVLVVMCLGQVYYLKSLFDRRK